MQQLHTVSSSTSTASTLTGLDALQASAKPGQDMQYMLVCPNGGGVTMPTAGQSPASALPARSAPQAQETSHSKAGRSAARHVPGNSHVLLQIDMTSRSQGTGLRCAECTLRGRAPTRTKISCAELAKLSST